MVWQNCPPPKKRLLTFGSLIIVLGHTLTLSTYLTFNASWTFEKLGFESFEHCPQKESPLSKACKPNHLFVYLTTLGFVLTSLLRICKKIWALLNLSIIVVQNCPYLKKIVFLRHNFLIITWIGLKFFWHQASTKIHLWWKFHKILHRKGPTSKLKMAWNHTWQH